MPDIKSRWVLPQTVHPETYRKFVICVPNERFYIAAFQGLLIELTYSKNWQRDFAHTAAIVSRVWQDALASVLCDDCAEIIITGESDYEMSICEQLRFHNGKLQGLCCGEWTDITGQTGIEIGGPGQPGDGAPQPDEGGGCQTYHASFAANSQWLVPTVVNAGDTIAFSNPDGSGQDGTVSPWRCPDGLTFFAGACVGLGGTSGGDPAPAINHMALVAEIDGVYYPAFSGTITVPGGVVNAPITIQANDSDLSDNSGSYALDIEVCNNVPEVWSHLLDFQISPHGFVVVSGNGVWTPGVGFEGVADMSGVHLRVNGTLDAATHITAFDVTYSVTDCGGDTNDIVRTYDGGSSLIHGYNGTTGDHGTVSNHTDAISGDSTGTASIHLANDAYPGGNNTFIKLRVYGIGPQPTWA